MQPFVNFARGHHLSLQPGHQHNRNADSAAYLEDAEHRSSCQLPLGSCCRCWFEYGFAGQLRKGSAAVNEPDNSLAWREKFTFEHPVAGKRTWLVVKPYAWGGPWAVGCWVCNWHSQLKWSCSFSRIDVTFKNCLCTSSFRKHQLTKGHKLALQSLLNSVGRPQPDDAMGLMTGVSDDVPRLEKFHLAASIVACRASLRDFEQYTHSQSIGSAAAQGSDESRKVCTQLIQAMAQPFSELDRLVVRCV